MENAIEINVGNKTCVPTREDVTLVSTLPPAWLARSGGYWNILQALLLAGFCLAVTCVPASGQDFTIIDRQQPFVITERAPDEVKAAGDAEYFMYVFTADYCSVCQVDKRAGKHDAIRKRWPYSVIMDVGLDDQWIRARDLAVNKLPRVERLPTVWLMRRGDNRHVLKVWTGSTSVEAIETEIRRLNDVPNGTVADPIPSCEGPKLNSSIYNGRQGSSHHCRECLISHLYQEGIHRGRHSLVTLQGLGDDQLESLHNRDHKW